ncbi:SET and MYND domain-containing protein 5 [Folsomia candida]|uniref:SET and MYND domain-containing protein 5 n=1 Tax=Folsomia candida TaxID=158441 RepID=A0A226DHK0_FOLCA|nr:SET and MYND domain-containing protein 5 [Folsomia candida]
MGRSDDFESVIPLGTMLIVKNPVFKKPLAKSTAFGLIVENPADIEFLSQKRMDALFPGVQWKSDLPNESRALVNSVFWEFHPDQDDLEIATKLKNVGNKAFFENRPTDAARFYNVALEYLSEEEITPAAVSILLDTLSNKAAAKLGCFNSVLICTGKILGIKGDHVKGIYRHAKALIGLGRYAEGGEFLDEKLNQFPSLGEECKDIVSLRSIIPELMKPPGKEIIRALLNPRPSETRLPQPQPPLPVGMADRIAEFRGPIQLGKSKVCDGEGIFASEDLEVGTHLLICTPFAGLYVEAGKTKEFTFNTSPPEYLIGSIANKIWLDPQLGHEFYSLWAGPDLKSLTMDNEEDAKKMGRVDIGRIKNISKYNFTGTLYNENDDEDFISGGVWIPSSKINHSCIDANAAYRPHDSSLIMMVTTFKKVKKGEEIITSYLDAFHPFSARNFMESHGFICKCRLCELDRSENPDVIVRIVKLLKSLAYDHATNLYPFDLQILTRDLITIAELERLRAATPDLNACMMSRGVLTVAAIVLMDEKRYTECFAMMQKIYAVLVNIPPNFMHHDLAATVLVCCMKMDKEKAVLEKWAEEVRKYCRLYAGTLKHVRVGHHPTVPEDLRKFGIEFFTDDD